MTRLFPPDQKAKKMNSATLNSSVVSRPKRFGLMEFIEGLLAGMRRNRDINETERALRAMSDRELADIGIHRGMIREIARQVPGAK